MVKTIPKKDRIVVNDIKITLLLLWTEVISTESNCISKNDTNLCSFDVPIGKQTEQKNTTWAIILIQRNWSLSTFKMNNLITMWRKNWKKNKTTSHEKQSFIKTSRSTENEREETLSYSIINYSFKLKSIWPALLYLYTCLDFHWMIWIFFVLLSSDVTVYTFCFWCMLSILQSKFSCEPKAQTSNENSFKCYFVAKSKFYTIRLGSVCTK